jgi:hypothetical protein
MSLSANIICLLLLFEFSDFRILSVSLHKTFMYHQLLYCGEFTELNVKEFTLTDVP